MRWSILNQATDLSITVQGNCRIASWRLHIVRMKIPVARVTQTAKNSSRDCNSTNQASALRVKPNYNHLISGKIKRESNGNLYNSGRGKCMQKGESSEERPASDEEWKLGNTHGLYFCSCLRWSYQSSYRKRVFISNSNLRCEISCKYICAILVHEEY